MSAIKVEFIVPFIKATYKIFESMVGMKVQRKEVYLKRGYLMFGEISGIIGLSGKMTGTCAISFPAPLAIQVIEQLLGEKVENGIHDIVTHDGVGEIINMISGQAKATLSETPFRFDITLPTIISGRGHEVFNKKGTQCVVILFETEDQQRFTLEVCTPEK